MIGRTISHYKIIEKLGEGGMGVVYKVQDTKLDRLLALKFLPPHLTVNDTDKARFLQEAKAASAINHPNVCIIHDIQEHDEQQFLVMEYVDGKTIRETIGTSDHAKLKIKDLIEYALQIAAALEAAHEEGIVHRDIKSENIMVSKKNQIKVMDFGLAKLKGSLKLTKTSSTVGTLAYMAPEQIEGKANDARSDIFSFGVVLYEMLTGKLPFSGEYESAIMYSIINEEPEPVENYRKDISSELVHVLNRSLEKDPEDRYQNMHDVLIDLNRVKRDSSKVSRKSLKEMPVPKVVEETIVPTIETKPKRKLAWFVPGIIISTLALLIIRFIIFNPFASPTLTPMITNPFTSLPGVEAWPTFSPDGTQIAFSWRDKVNGDFDIYIKLIGAGSKQLLVTNPGHDFMPKWSPDGRYIAFGRVAEVGDKECDLYIIPIRGGTERKLASVNYGREWYGYNDLCWSADSKSIAFSAMDSSKDFKRIYLLSVDSRQTQILTDGPDINLNDTYCAISPDGKKLAFARGVPGSRDIYIVSMSGGEAVQLTSNNSSIWGLTWTKDGSEIIFGSGHSISESSLWRISATGGDIRRVPESGGLSFPTAPKQGNLLACIHMVFDQNIWRLEMPTSKGEKNIPSKFIYSTQVEGSAKYSADGNKIVYNSDRSGSWQVWICDSNGKKHEQLTNLGGNNPNWSPDGSKITYTRDFEDQNDIFTISVLGGSPIPITNNPADDHYSSYSKDGKWIYFTSNRGGMEQIWKIPTQGGKAVQVTTKGGYIFRESIDGNWIYYSKYDTTGIWKKSLPQGDETLVLKDYLDNGKQWDLVEDGIYFIEGKGKGSLFYFYDFTDETITKIADLGEEHSNNLDVSSDQQWILYTQEVEHQADIVLVENFR